MGCSIHSQERLQQIIAGFLGNSDIGICHLNLQKNEAEWLEENYDTSVIVAFEKNLKSTKKKKRYAIIKNTAILTIK